MDVGLLEGVIIRIGGTIGIYEMFYCCDEVLESLIERWKLGQMATFKALWQTVI